MPKTNETPTAPDRISCAVCKKELPASEAISPEAQDYVIHFCGGACRAAWEREQADALVERFEARSGVKRD